MTQNVNFYIENKSVFKINIIYEKKKIKNIKKTQLFYLIDKFYNIFNKLFMHE